MQIEQKILNIRRDIIELGYRCGTSAHFGGGLSIVDLLSVLYAEFLRYSAQNIHDPNRDIFILSKGHGVLGFFAVLKNFGFIPEELFYTFQQNGSQLIAHPILNHDIGVESSNGSLGQGLSFASGIALAALKKKQDRRVFVLLGDGECNEGLVWESAFFCAEYRLANLTAIIDSNGYQNDGAVHPTTQNLLRDKWHSFGWHTLLIDGHDIAEIRKAYELALTIKDKPVAIIAKTIKGQGISFMQHNNDWHHNLLTKKNYDLAMQELGVSNASGV